MGEEIFSFIIIVSLILLALALLVVVVIINYKRKQKIHLREKNAMQQEFSKQFLQSQIEVQEQTFQQIGKELHDNVGQLLSTSRMLLGLTERTMDHPPDTLLTANATLAQAINELRSLSKSLDKEWLEQFSFTDNLETEIQRINAGNKVLAEFKADHFLPLASDKQIILFRIVQEAIQNAIKHGQPRHMLIQTKEEENNYCIVISDDGNGFDQHQKGNGMGLVNMKHRTNLLGGNITWNSIPAQGTTVCIYLPLKQEQDENIDRIGG